MWGGGGGGGGEGREMKEVLIQAYYKQYACEDNAISPAF